MKIKLSKSKWEEIGNESGWMKKTAQSEELETLRNLTGALLSRRIILLQHCHKLFQEGQYDLCRQIIEKEVSNSFEEICKKLSELENAKSKKL